MIMHWTLRIEHSAQMWNKRCIENNLKIDESMSESRAKNVMPGKKEYLIKCNKQLILLEDTKLKHKCIN